MKPLRLMLARFPGGAAEHPACVDWLIETTAEMARDRRIECVLPWWANTTPITMARNRAVRHAISQRADLLLMIDSDMGPDLGGPLKFWPRALDFIAERWETAPTVAAAPYCGAPPVEEVMVMRWRSDASDHPQPDYRLDLYKREEAADRHGYEAVAAVPTGLVAIDMRIFTGFRGLRLEPPWFYYEYTDEQESELASTEDVVFSRNVDLVFHDFGPTVFIDWDAWATHYKLKAVGRPLLPMSAPLAALFERQAKASVKVCHT